MGFPSRGLFRLRLIFPPSSRSKEAVPFPRLSSLLYGLVFCDRSTSQPVLLFLTLHPAGWVWGAGLASRTCLAGTLPGTPPTVEAAPQINRHSLSGKVHVIGLSVSGAPFPSTI